MSKKGKENMSTKKIVMSAVFMALIVVATAFISIPLPLGYVHLGDMIIVIACFMLKPKYSIPVSAIGSALADLILGYYLYIPATLIVKAVFATCFAIFFSKDINLVKTIIALVLGSLIIPAGYLIFETIVYGFGAAVASIVFNLLQGAVCSLIGGIIANVFAKIPAITNLKSQL